MAETERAAGDGVAQYLRASERKILEAHAAQAGVTLAAIAAAYAAESARRAADLGVTPGGTPVQRVFADAKRRAMR